MRPRLLALLLLAALVPLPSGPAEGESKPPNPASQQPAPPAKITPASLPLRLLRPRVHEDMALADLQALMGSPDRIRNILDAGDCKIWEYDALDGRIELTVSPSEGGVRWIDVRPSLSLTRLNVRVGMTVGQAQKALSLAMSHPHYLIAICVGHHREADEQTHQVSATDGTFDIWADHRTGRIKRVVEERQPVTGH